MEEWKDIIGYENLYQVSSYGRIRNVRTNRILKPFNIARNKYAGIALIKDNKKTTARINRLVATAFIDNPENKPCVNHKDYDKHNNRVDNLEWVTYSENNIYSLKNQPIFRNRKTNSGEPNITYYNGRYRVVVKRKHYGYFDTLKDAVKFRNMVREKIYEQLNNK